MADRPQWLIREDAGLAVLVALALRQTLGIRAPEELPGLRGLESRAPDGPEAGAAVARQWRAYWDMTVEPRAHTSDVPLELVEGFDTLVALPARGAEELHAAILPHAEAVRHYAEQAHSRYVETASDSAYRAYASAIAEFEREAGRRARSFELNVHVLPFTQRGIWWIGALTVAVTDGLRRDVVAFDSAITPIIAELA